MSLVTEGKSNFGIYCGIAAGSIALCTTVVTVPFLTPGFRRICLPFVPATKTQISNVLKALEGHSGSLIDIGSGDGRIVLSASKAGFRAAGVELNLWLVLYSRITSILKGYYSVKFIRRNLWKFDLSPYSNVVVFGTENMMIPFENKLINELPNKAVVIACRFPLPTIQPTDRIGSGVDTVWKYVLQKS